MVLIDDQKRTIDILQSVMGQQITVEPIFKPPAHASRIELNAFHQIHSRADLRHFRIKGMGIDLVRQAAVDKLGFWTKVSLGWATFYESAHQGG